MFLNNCLIIVKYQTQGLQKKRITDRILFVIWRDW